MGNSESCGFGVLNSTQHKLTVCLTMSSTHYWEENVMPGKIFYRWPGAVWYTVYVYPTIGTTFTSSFDSIFQFDRNAMSGVNDIPTACTLTAANALRDSGIVLNQSTEIDLLQAYSIPFARTIDDFEPRLKSLKNDVVQAFAGSQLETSMGGLYGGGQGSWVEVQGLPEVYQTGDGNVAIKERDIVINLESYSEIFGRGEFTDYSRGQYYT